MPRIFFDVLAVGDVVRVDQPFLLFDRMMKVGLPAAAHGKVLKVDGEQDVLIQFPSLHEHVVDTMC